MTLRISYRVIFSKVRESIPSVSRVKEMVISDENDIGEKRSKGDTAYRKKAEELEKKIAELQKHKK